MKKNTFVIIKIFKIYIVLFIRKQLFDRSLNFVYGLCHFHVFVYISDRLSSVAGIPNF